MSKFRSIVLSAAFMVLVMAGGTGAASTSRPPDDWQASTGTNPSVSVLFVGARVDGRWFVFVGDEDKQKPNHGRFHYTVTTKPSKARISVQLNLTKYPSAHEDVHAERKLVGRAPYAGRINCGMPCSAQVSAGARPKDYYGHPWHGKITLKVWID